MGKFIALLRGINVGGRTIIPMAGLRELCETLGWTNVRTYIQSGNIVFDASGKPAALETAFEKGVATRFGFEPAVIVRSEAQLKAIAATNPFPEASESEPNRILLGLSKAKPKPGATAALQERATAGERVEQAGAAIWFHYPAGVGTSKLSPSLIDRLVGSPLTARNWRTILRLTEMVDK